MKTVGFIFATLAASCLLSFSALALVVAGTDLKEADVVLVVSYPWGAHASQVIAQSGLSETYPLRAPLGSLTVIETSNDLINLRKNGAWLVLDGKKVASLCTPKM